MPKLNPYLPPIESQYTTFQSTVLARLYTIGPWICGIALGGSIIPFFMNTTVPYLLWLSNIWVLSSLVIASAIIWAVIYSSQRDTLLHEAYFKQGDKPSSQLYSDITLCDKYNSSEQAIDDKTADNIASLIIIKERSVNRKQNTASSDLECRAQAKTLRTYIQQDSMGSGTLTNEKEAVCKVLDKIITQCQSDDAPTETPLSISANSEKNRLELNRKYPIQRLLPVFNTIGWLNALLVNSIGIAISGLSFSAFIWQMAFQVGIITTPTLPIVLAATVTTVCFGAGVIAAAIMTRIKTVNVGENALYSFFTWYNDNKTIKDICMGC